MSKRKRYNKCMKIMNSITIAPPKDGPLPTPEEIDRMLREIEKEGAGGIQELPPTDLDKPNRIPF